MLLTGCYYQMKSNLLYIHHKIYDNIEDITHLEGSHPMI